MGTNFYWYEKTPCECCKREFEPIHIGKSSGGWCFSLHVEPEKGLATLDDWKAKFAQPGSIIKDEYGDTVPPSVMLERITERSHPRGLTRHEIDPRNRHCIGHGEGTWDYIVGEFS